MKTETIEYKHGDKICEGYIAYDDSKEGKRPGVMIVHDWMGPGEHTRERAEWLAKLGYVGFAVDIYGKDTRPSNRDEAAAAAGPFFEDRAGLRKAALAGFETMKAQDIVDGSKTGCIGFCFGGLTALEIARAGTDIAGVVSFHGILATPKPEDAKNIKAKVLVLHGVDDPMVAPDQSMAFWKEMRATKADWQFIGYGNTVHAFTNKQANDPDFGTVYDAKADTRSWEHMKLFFKEVFGV